MLYGLHLLIEKIVDITRLQHIEGRKKHIIILCIWIASAVVLFMPDGVISQIKLLGIGGHFSPTGSIIAILAIYGINYLRVLVHFASSGRYFKPTFQGAIWSVASSLLLVLFYATREQAFWTFFD